MRSAPMAASPPAKFAAALFTGSGAMLAEAIHSLADCTNQLFLLSGLKEASKPANRIASDGLRPGRVLLGDDGGAVAVLPRRRVFGHAGHRAFQHPEPLRTRSWRCSVLGISVALEGFSLYGAMKEIRKIARRQAFLQVVSRNPAVGTDGGGRRRHRRAGGPHAGLRRRAAGGGHRQPGMGRAWLDRGRCAADGGRALRHARSQGA